MSDVYTCQKAGCNYSTHFWGRAEWHFPEPDEDPRGGHNVNALILCPEHWRAAKRIGFTL